MQNHIQIRAEIGSPAADCKYFGICSTELLSDQDWVNFTPTRVRQTKAILSLASSDQLLFSFPISGMLSETREQFFSASGFKVDTPYFLPKFAIEAFNLPLGSSIKPGTYTVAHRSEASLDLSLEVLMPLQPDAAPQQVGKRVLSEEVLEATVGS